MHIASIQPIIATLWMSAVSIAGIALKLDSFSSWTVLAAAAVVPPLVMVWRWNDPRQTLSETIQDALR